MSFSAVSHRLTVPSSSFGFSFDKKYKLLKARGNGALIVRAEIRYVNSSEAKKLVTEEGYTVLDIRDKTQFERAHIKSCHHVPLFIENTDNDIGTIVKRQMHNNFSGLFYGLPYTKTSPDFVSKIEKEFPKDSKLLLVCQEGLRSGVAAKKLETAGYKNLSYITSGLQSVAPGTFEKEGSKELKDAGKAGLVTIQGKISIVLGTILITALLFITIFPDQAVRDLVCFVPIVLIYVMLGDQF